MIRTHVKTVLVFLVHQLIGTQGVIFATSLSVVSVKFALMDISQPLGHSLFMRDLSWLLSSNPFYPLDIAVGLWFGWQLFSWWHHHEMFIVWIVPAVILMVAVVAVPTFTPARISMLDLHGGPLEHYFGWRCPTEDGCIDQILATLPLYTSAAYSTGAWLAYRKKRGSFQTTLRKNQRGNKSRMPA